MLAGRSGVGPITHFDSEGFPVRIAAEVKGFDAVAAVGRRDARRLGRFQQFAVVAGDEALADAGLSREGTWPDLNRFGIYVGTGIAGFPEICERSIELDQGTYKHIPPTFLPRALNNVASGQMAIRYGARGPSLCISTACACGNHSIGEAYRAILFGDADVILAGGTEAAICGLGVGSFMVMRALSRNEDPTTASRPFDKNRDGFVMGEGAGVLVLEDLEHAQARGAPIYCEITGYGNTTDAHHVTAPSPDGDGASRCMNRALESAGRVPADVDYINAHGTSTPINDRTETAAIKALFGEQAYKVPISSTKSVSGHLLGAAGGLEAVATVMAIHTGMVPPTANYQTPDPDCDLDYIVEGARELHPKVAMSNGFGFGGTNASILFEKFTP